MPRKVLGRRQNAVARIRFRPFQKRVCILRHLLRVFAIGPDVDNRIIGVVVHIHHWKNTQFTPIARASRAVITPS